MQALNRNLNVHPKRKPWTSGLQP